MDNHSLETIEHEIALLVRLTTAISPKLGELDRSGYVLLGKLQDGNPLAINVLADELKLNLSTASRQIVALEEKGYIRRFPDEKNGRTSLVEITPQGHVVYQEVKKARVAGYTRILHDYTQDEIEQLETALTRLNQAFVKLERTNTATHKTSP
ncbi:MAG: MarR family winged helix-turn-helix transcriptional regulator [Tumebacillaceae bacterium]